MKLHILFYLTIFSISAFTQVNETKVSTESNVKKFSKKQMDEFRKALKSDKVISDHLKKGKTIYWNLHYKGQIVYSAFLTKRPMPDEKGAIIAHLEVRGETSGNLGGFGLSTTSYSLEDKNFVSDPKMNCDFEKKSDPEILAQDTAKILQEMKAEIPQPKNVLLPSAELKPVAVLIKRDEAKKISETIADPPKKEIPKVAKKPTAIIVEIPKIKTEIPGPKTTILPTAELKPVADLIKREESKIEQDQKIEITEEVQTKKIVIVSNSSSVNEVLTDDKQFKKADLIMSIEVKFLRCSPNLDPKSNGRAEILKLANFLLENPGKAVVLKGNIAKFIAPEFMPKILKAHKDGEFIRAEKIMDKAKEASFDYSGKDLWNLNTQEICYDYKPTDSRHFNAFPRVGDFMIARMRAVKAILMEAGISGDRIKMIKGIVSDMKVEAYNYKE